MKIEDYYQDAIDALFDTDIDYKQVCINVAKLNPEVFVKSCGLSSVRAETMREYVANGKVAAIKLYRHMTGKGLIEAKETIEKWESEVE